MRVKQHEGIGTVKIRSRRKEAIDPSEGGAIAALSATSSSTLFSHFTRKKQSTASSSSTGTGRAENQGEGDQDEDSDSESLADDGLSSDSSEGDVESGADDDDALSTLHESPMMLEDTVQTIYNSAVGLPPPPKTAPPALAPATKRAGSWLGAKTLRPASATRQSTGTEEDEDQFDSPGVSIPGTPGTGLTTPGGTKATKRPIFKRNKSRAPSKKSSRRDFNFDANTAADVQGIVIMEIQKANDLPKLKNGQSPATPVQMLVPRLTASCVQPCASRSTWTRLSSFPLAKRSFEPA